MALENGQGHAPPSWFVSPGEQDFFAWLALALVALAIYGIFYLYAKFDKWAEHRSKGTPLAKTIPTMLAIALLYEIFPLGHFNILLPIAAILIALMADWSHYRFGQPEEEAADPPEVGITPVAGPASAGHGDVGSTSQAAETGDGAAAIDGSQTGESSQVSEDLKPAEDKKPISGEAQNA